MKYTQIIQYWIETSDKDYLTVKHLYESQDYHWSLFIGHLVIEKLLKAIYVQKYQKNAPRIHDLARLAEKCDIQFDDEKLDKLELITKFNLSVRYPDYRQEFYKMCTEEFTLNALSSIEEIRLWLKSLIKEY